MPPRVAKVGFTLAEVLITLGIIGIVAAMTIPTLIENQRNKEFQVKYKKVYSELNQVAKLYFNDNEETIPTAISSSHTDMKKILLKYVKGIAVINSERWDSTEEDGNPSDYVYKRYKNFKGEDVKDICDISGVLTNINGTSYGWNDNPRLGENGPILCVDLNGDTKPNVTGIDYFLFIFTQDGAVIPMGVEYEANTKVTYPGSNFWLDKTHCNDRNNYSCSYWAFNDKNPKGAGTYWKDFIGKKLYKK